MRKKLFLTISIGIFLIVLLINNSFATQPFSAIYMVGSDGSTLQKDIFDFNDPTPWLYLKTPETHFYDLTLSFYTSPTGDDYWTYAINSPGPEIWLSLDDGFSGIFPPTAIDWVDIKEIGQWDVTAKYAGCSPGCDIYAGTTNFSVVPEPVSSALFIIGGAVLGFRSFRKMKKA